LEKRLLGKSGLKVPVIGMGTWNTFDVSEKGAEANCRLIVDHALEIGANFFDSSPMYGKAEQILGSTLQGRRDAAMVATKVWAGSSREGEDQIKKAMTYFGGFVDLYQIHNLLNWQEHLKTLENLKEQGKIKAIGATHYSSSAFNGLAELMRTGRITTIQIPYNPSEREVERVILPLAADLGIGVVVMRPFGEGTLFRQLPSKGGIDSLSPFGVKTGAQVLLKWILSDPRCHVAIPATSSPQHMKENGSAGDPPWFGPEERAYVSQLAGR
jgi:aryl-alcohol dehydrogenase-like predicted oxidoreductase